MHRNRDCEILDQTKKNLYLVSKEICSSRTMKSTKNSKKISLVSYMKVNGKMLSM